MRRLCGVGIGFGIVPAYVEICSCSWLLRQNIAELMMKGADEAFSALLAICAGNSPVTDEFPAQRPVTRSFDVLFDLHLNKRLSKEWRGWWYETPSRPLCRHYNVL